MNIHEYQAKKILNRYGIFIPRGKVAYTPNEAKRAAVHVSLRGPWMLKAQIQSGAREKGFFIGSHSKKGGIRLIKRRRDIIREAEQMLGETLVTAQTGPKGKFVSRIYVEAFQKVRKKFYAGLVINRVVPVLTLLLANLEDGGQSILDKVCGRLSWLGDFCNSKNQAASICKSFLMLCTAPLWKMMQR